ncbi:MAG: DUF4843 domain-containing protein [Candidatus Pseudobacter hemicellulosilyticus]|uniref:DUF4843 domain-containing protein n=1 Tax=Candidatus Pseudobacter hemicellulosilyticus TaxID=3121375 RepID=A0AAJ6BE42_9BACT|nr:MAG: DUF4843 domain-containing protein [Pseudobacter sp.]
MNWKLIRVAILLFWLPLAGCEKDLMDYEGVEGLYFAVQHGSPSYSERSWPYQPYSPVEFTKLGKDTATVLVKLQITGPVKDYDRPYKVIVNPDSTTAQAGVHYLPLPENGVVAAGAINTYLPVTLILTPEMSTRVIDLGLKIVPNEHFGLSFTEWDMLPDMVQAPPPLPLEFDASLHTLRISNFIRQPTIWAGSVNASNQDAGSWGGFTTKKIQLMFTLFNLTYEDFMSAETMPLVLRNFIAQEGGMYLIKMFNAGTPVLEDDGRLMFIGSVPWKSTLGVPYIP